MQLDAPAPAADSPDPADSDAGAGAGGADAGAGAAPVAKEGGGAALQYTMAMGSILEVEVAEPDGSVEWRPSRVVELRAGGRFVACVNGDAGTSGKW